MYEVTWPRPHCWLASGLGRQRPVSSLCRVAQQQMVRQKGSTILAFSRATRGATRRAKGALREETVDVFLPVGTTLSR